MRILEIQSSPMGAHSASREVSGRLLQRWMNRYPDAMRVTHDFGGSQGLPHWTGEQVQASFTPIEARSKDQARCLEVSDRLCRELEEADLILIASPMWNFTIPSSLKAWIDHVVRAGVTFKYTEKGPVGLLSAGKRLFVVQASGGFYQSPSPMESHDHVGVYLRQIFGFLGVQDCQVIRAEGTALSRPEAVGAGLQAVEAMVI